MLIDSRRPTSDIADGTVESVLKGAANGKHLFLWDGWAMHVIFDDIMISMISIEIQHIQPIGSMYCIYANIGGILMVNVTIYSIHGSYG